jgi:hypothetical protein
VDCFVVVRPSVVRCRWIGLLDILDIRSLSVVGVTTGICVSNKLNSNQLNNKNTHFQIVMLKSVILRLITMFRFKIEYYF